jgi:two-component system cell cycle sensor histidine kinase/response regulator CckA
MRQTNPSDSATLRVVATRLPRCSLVDRAPFGICRSSLARDRFESVNPAFCQMLGYSELELLGMSVSREVYPKVPNRSEIGELLLREHKLSAQETWFRRKDGSQVRVRVTAYLTPNEDGVLDIVEAYVEDLTEQSALEQQIRAVQKLEAVGRLAGGVAHDFNNILVVIKLSTEMMLGQVTPENPLTRSLLQVSHAADRASALTKQMLAFSRRQVMQARVVNVNCVVRDTLHMLQRIIGEDVQLVTRLAENLSNTTLDPDQLGQIVVNLAVNARDAMPDGGLLQIETSNVDLDEGYARTHPPVQPGRYVMLAVTDDGIGIDRADLPRIFDPFFTTKELGKGTGLGLSIVYGIVKQSGGYIWVYSEPGLGTTFKLYFPVTLGNAGLVSPRMGASGRAEGETILVVEDDDAIRTNVRDCLRHLGYSALDASSGEVALGLCEQAHGKIDVIMTDLVMPGMGGHELASQIERRYPGICLLYTSGYSEDGASRRQLLDAGKVFLEKPYTVADLDRAVQRALVQTRLHNHSASVG